MEETQETPSWLLALGKEPPPERIELMGSEYRLDRVLKHDFHAFTAIYAGDPGKVVLKIGRRASFFGLPLGWMGRLHAWHESNVLREVEDLDVAPRFTGRFGKDGITHRYIEGHSLRRGEHVPDDFFARLRSGLREIHARRMAYVDLEKCENVLVGDDGRPYLIDFQISYRWPFRRGGNLFPLRWLRTKLQNGDSYHLIKLQSKSRPDQLAPEEWAVVRHRPLAIRVYNGLTRPLTRLRRRVLKRVDPASRKSERGRVPDRASRASRG